MEKIQKRIISNKLLVVVPLCLILLVVTVVSKEDPENPESPQPFFQDGIYYDPIIPEIMVSPLNYSTEPVSLASTTYPLDIANLYDGVGDGKITLYVLMAYDDDFLSHSYETPNGILNAVDYARHRTAKAFLYFFLLFDIRFLICGEVTWQSDADSDLNRYYEAVQETHINQGWAYGGGYMIPQGLIAWTTELGDRAGMGSSEERTALISSQGFAWDDNIVHHELSHVFNLPDGTLESYQYEGNNCYYEECIMSYRTEYIDHWYEGGQTWEVHRELPQAYLTHMYCGVRSLDQDPSKAESDTCAYKLYAWFYKWYSSFWIEDAIHDC